MIVEYNIAEGVTAFSTTRHGGVGKGAYESFNINSFCGDDKKVVEKNKELLCQKLGISVDDIFMPHQVHKDSVIRIIDEHLSLSKEELSLLLEGKDSLITNIKGICIGVSTADCVPILLYDKKNKAVAAIHAGWRGTVKRIAQKTIKEMIASFNTNEEDLLAVIGPCISLKAFEVGDEVWEEFFSSSFDMEKIALRKDKWHIDLPRCNKLQLMEMGVKESNITLSGICSYFSNQDFFSARRMGINSGRTFTGIILR